MSIIYALYRKDEKSYEYNFGNVSSLGEDKIKLTNMEIFLYL